LLLLNAHVFAITIKVKQDGTGNYSTIQEAVENAMPYDTVLVWPGIYHEHVIIEDKALWLGSLMLTTGDSTFAYSTIIDADNNSACIAVHSNYSNTNVFIYGFTIRNGSGYTHPQWSGDHTLGGGVFFGEGINFGLEGCIIHDNTCIDGGGILVYTYASGYIKDCRIYNNKAVYGSGGGICVFNYATLLLSGNSIYSNHSTALGGGLIYGASHSVTTFDSVNRNSIYNNYARMGCDINKGVHQEASEIFLDTCSVLEPERYFIYCADIHGFFNDEGVSYDIRHGWIEPIDADLYVDPINGNDENCGLSFGEPLRTIAFALSKVAIDSLEPNTIHLADGVYSDTLNGEKFTLGLRQFVNIEGSSPQGTVLDGELKYLLIRPSNLLSDYKLSKMTLTRGIKPQIDQASYLDDDALMNLYRQGENITIDSMIFKESWCQNGDYHVGIWGGNNIRITNCQFLDNLGGDVLAATGDSIGDTTYVSNCIFSRSGDNNELSGWDYYCHGVQIGGSHDATAIITNSLFNDNTSLTFSSVFGYSFSSTVHNNYFANCTFANNSTEENMGGIMWIGGSRNHFYNCIFYDESGLDQKIMLTDTENVGKSWVGIWSSLVQGGEEIIFTEDRPYYYDTLTNIDYDGVNPLFLGMWDHPYQIADGSPCINMGTLANLPDFIEIPQTDLAGNPRIVGDSIDMGCYEWNPTIVGFNEIGPGNKKEKPKLLVAAPNPFENSTRISIEYQSQQNVRLEVYDNFGRRVKILLNSSFSKGDYKLQWDGTDNNGKNLPMGVYYVIMFSGEKEVESLKVIKK